MKPQTNRAGLDSSARPILLIEDNAMDIDFALQAFDEHKIGNPVVICRDGEEALAFIAAHTSPQDLQVPAVVLLDLHLPLVDGIEVLRQARRHPTWKLVPIVVLTSSRESTDISKAYEFGVNSYIVKPVSFPAFADVVKQIKTYWLLANEPPFGEPTHRPS